MMLENILIAIALAMDCFAVSTVCGVIINARDKRTMFTLAFFFGLFQAAMPLIGWVLTREFSSYIEAVDHWIAFGMLALIGTKMIIDSFKEEESVINPQKLGSQLLLAIATSIDALAVGITYACTGYTTLGQLGAPLVTIGLVSFAFSIAGYLIGARFGDAVNKKVRPELLGGIILLGIGIRILIEHLG